MFKYKMRNSSLTRLIGLFCRRWWKWTHGVPDDSGEDVDDAGKHLQVESESSVDEDLVVVHRNPVPEQHDEGQTDESEDDHTVESERSALVRHSQYREDQDALVRNFQALFF